MEMKKRSGSNSKPHLVLVQTRQPLREEETPPCLHANMQILDTGQRTLYRSPMATLLERIKPVPDTQKV